VAPLSFIVFCLTGNEEYEKWDRDVTYSIALHCFGFTAQYYIILCFAVVTLWATPTCSVETVGVFEVSGGSGIGGLGTDIPEAVKGRRVWQKVANYNVKFDHI